MALATSCEIDMVLGTAVWGVVIAGVAYPSFSYLRATDTVTLPARAAGTAPIEDVQASVRSLESWVQRVRKELHAPNAARTAYVEEIVRTATKVEGKYAARGQVLWQHEWGSPDGSRRSPMTGNRPSGRVGKPRDGLPVPRALVPLPDARAAGFPWKCGARAPAVPPSFKPSSRRRGLPRSRAVPRTARPGP